MAEKLTKAQVRLLEDIGAGSDGCVKAYRPAWSLSCRGLVEWFDDDEYRGRLRITPAGCAALEAHDAG
jgi:hypothetical protein